MGSGRGRIERGLGAAVAVLALHCASADTHARFADIATGGIYQDKGMPSFAGRLSPDELRRIQAYVLSRACRSR